MSRAISALIDQFTVGKTTTRSFTDTAARFQLEASTYPKLFLLYADQDCHVRQGGDSVTATTSDLLLKADTYIQVVVRDSAESYVSVVQVDTNGTLRSTEVSSADPGTGTSGAA
jgi:hypothetical protein